MIMISEYLLSPFFRYVYKSQISVAIPFKFLDIIIGNYCATKMKCSGKIAVIIIITIIRVEAFDSYVLS